MSADDTGLSWGRLSVDSSEPGEMAALRLFGGDDNNNEAGDRSVTMSARRKTVDPQELLELFAKDDTTVRDIRRDTIDPSELSKWLGKDENSVMKSARRKTIDPRELSGLFSNGRPSDVIGLSESVQPRTQSSPQRTPRAPQTPPSPPPTASKQIKSILRSSKKDQTKATATRSVSFVRKRTVLSFDNRQPVINLTPATKSVSKPTMAMTNESPADLVARTEKKRANQLRQIEEEDASVDEEQSANENVVESKQQSRFFTDRDSPAETDQTMDVPKFSEFMQDIAGQDALPTQNGGYDSAQGMQAESETNIEDDRTMDIPSLMDFRRSSTVGIPPFNPARESVTAEIPQLSHFMDAPEDTRSRRETLAVPSILDFAELGDSGLDRRSSPPVVSSVTGLSKANHRETLAIPSLTDLIMAESSTTPRAELRHNRPDEESLSQPNSKRRRETLAIPSLTDFMQENPGKNADSRRLTLDVPSLMDFIQNDPGRAVATAVAKSPSASDDRTLDVPSIPEFLQQEGSKTLPQAEPLDTPQEHAVNLPSTAPLPRSIGEAINEFFPDRQSVMSPLQPVSASALDLTAAITLMEANLITGKDVSDALVGVHMENCLNFCEEQLAQVSEQRGMILTNKQLALPFPRTVPTSSVPGLAHAAKLDAQTELNDWMNQVHRDYLDSLTKQLLRVSEDSDLINKKLTTLAETKSELESKLKEAEGTIALQERIKMIKAAAEKVQQRIAGLTKKSRELETELVTRRKQLDECRRRLEALQTSVEPPLQETEVALEMSLVQLSMQQELSLWVLQNATLDSADIVFPTFTVHLAMESNRTGDRAFARLRVSGQGVDEYVRNLLESKEDGRWALDELSNLLNVIEEHYTRRLASVSL